jgi:hypothetical protein
MWTELSGSGWSRYDHAMNPEVPKKVENLLTAWGNIGIITT